MVLGQPNIAVFTRPQLGIYCELKNSDSIFGFCAKNAFGIELSPFTQKLILLRKNLKKLPALSFFTSSSLTWNFDSYGLKLVQQKKYLSISNKCVIIEYILSLSFYWYIILVLTILSSNHFSCSKYTVFWWKNRFFVVLLKNCYFADTTIFC